MPTIFERIETALVDNQLTVRLNQQSGNLTSVAKSVVNFVQNPPQNVGDVVSTINELPIPDLNISGDFTAALSNLQTVIPSDLTPVTGSLVDGLGQLATTVENDLTRVVNDVLSAILAIYRLTQIDWRCEKRVDETADGSGGSPDDSDSDGADGPADGDGNDAAAAGGTTVSEANAQLTTLETLLDALPTPFTLASLFDLVRLATGLLEREDLLPGLIPVFDDLVEPLQTLSTWQALDATQIRNHMIESLDKLIAFISRGVAGLISQLAVDLNATAADLHAAELAQIADDITVRLNELAAAVRFEDLSTTAGAVDEINVRVDEFAALRSAIPVDSIAGLNRRLSTLPDNLRDQMNHLLLVLQPTQSLGVAPAFQSFFDGDDQNRFEQLLQPLVSWLEDLVDQIDIAAITQPIEQVASTAGSKIDELEQGMAGVAVQVRTIFADVESLIDGVDTQKVIDEATDAITSFRTQLSQHLAQLFEPARNAVEQVVQLISEQAGEFNPQTIVSELQGAIDSIKTVLQDPAVASAMETVRDALETATQLFDQLSFTPVTDQVIEGIGAVETAIGSIDSELLTGALKAALSAALAVLPDDLSPLTNPLIDEFAELVDEGPVAILESTRGHAQRLMDDVRRFEPAALIGDSLSAPFDELVASAEGFQPSRWFGPVKRELDKLKQRLRQQANPVGLLDGLQAPFDRLTAALENLNPDELVRPLDEAITGTIDRVLDALPVDEVFAQVDDTLKRVEEVVDFGRRLVAVIDKLTPVLAAFGDAQNQIDNWVRPVLDKVEAIGDLGPLSSKFAELSAALDETKSAALTATFETVATPLLAELDAAEPATKLTALAQAYGAFPRQALAALGLSAEKTALQDVLNRFDPLSPLFNAPYQTLSAYRQSLREAKTRLNATLADWDQRYHASESVLSQYRLAGPTSNQLRQLVLRAVETDFSRPFTTICSQVAAVTEPLGAFVAPIHDLVTELQSSVEDLLSGPDALGEIRDSFDGLIQRLRSFNLDFLKENVQSAFSSARDKLNSLSPRDQLRPPIETEFNAMLNSINVELVVSADQLDQLDADYAQVVDEIKDLNPETLVTQQVQPLFEQEILPLIETFDVTGLLEAIIAALGSLDEQLKAEIERVNSAFRNMKDRAQSLTGSAGISL